MYKPVDKDYGVGKAWNHTKRVRETCLSDTVSVHPLYLLVKDHKQPDADGKHKTRPVVSSQSGMPYRLNNLLDDVLEPVADQVPGSPEVESTEDLLHDIESVNKLLKSCSYNRMPSSTLAHVEELFLLGVVAAALFLSLDKFQTAKVARWYVEATKVEFSGINWKEMARYIAIHQEPVSFKY